MSCNQKKGAKQLSELGWRLARPPRAPTMLDLAPPLGGGVRNAPDEWEAYLVAAGGKAGRGLGLGAGRASVGGGGV